MQVVKPNALKVGLIRTILGFSWGILSTSNNYIGIVLWEWNDVPAT